MKNNPYISGQSRWDDIEDLIKRWKRKRPDEFAENMRWIKERRAEQKDKKFGFIGEQSQKGVGGGGTRLGLMLHPELIEYIKTFHPDFLSKNTDVKEFRTRFPAWRISEKW